MLVLKLSGIQRILETLDLLKNKLNSMDKENKILVELKEKLLYSIVPSFVSVYSTKIIEKRKDRRNKDKILIVP